MSDLRALPLTRGQVAALRAKLNAARGLPRVASFIGAHVPPEICVTTEAVGIEALDDGTFEAHVPPELEARLSATERTRLRSPTVREVPVLEPARLDEPLAPSPR